MKLRSGKILNVEDEIETIYEENELVIDDEETVVETCVIEFDLEEYLTKYAYICPVNEMGDPIPFKTKYNNKVKYIEHLPHFLKELYSLINDPTNALLLGNWNIVSYEEALKNYKSYCSGGVEKKDKKQDRVWEIACLYESMGYNTVICCDLYTQKLFKRRSCCMWPEYEFYHKAMLNYNGDAEQYEFCDWITTHNSYGKWYY